MARTDFCNLDSTLNAVCTAIGDARLLILQANCLAAGNLSCLPRPFVYHPASFEVANQAWVHDTVRHFYTSLDPNSCPDEQTQAAEAVNTCAAKNVNVFRVLLEICRLVMQKAVTLVAGTMYILVEVLTTMDKGNMASMRAQVKTDWLWYKRQFGDFVETLSDLVTDLMLNSGQLGAKLSTFLSKSCHKTGDLVGWLAEQWCRLIRRYLVNAFKVLTTFVGQMGSALTTIDDVFNAIFGGIMPMQLLAKYGLNRAFRSMMTEKFSTWDSGSKDPVASKVAQENSRLAQSAAATGAVGGAAATGQDGQNLKAGKVNVPSNVKPGAAASMSAAARNTLKGAQAAAKATGVAAKNAIKNAAGAIGRNPMTAAAGGLTAFFMAQVFPFDFLTSN